MGDIRWIYYGPLVVAIGDDLVVHGRGRIGQRLDDPGGWRAEVNRLGVPFDQSLPVHRVPSQVRIPGGGHADAYGGLPVVVAGGVGKGLWLLLDGDDPPPDLPRTGPLAAAVERIRWRLAI